MNPVDWSLWTGWHNLTGIDWDTVPAQCGAYIVASARPISRAVGIDQEGFLDVGESVDLAERLRAFNRCATNPGKTGHMAGWRFAHLRLSRHFPIEQLRVRWRTVATKDDAYSLEGEILRAYVTQHGELPPLNYKFNWDHID